jgi:hypothetical protein
MGSNAFIKTGVWVVQALHPVQLWRILILTALFFFGILDFFLK